MKYENSNEFALAFENDIESRAKNNDVLRQDLKNDTALERLTARFDPDSVAVKGGFGIRTLVEKSPYTQDLDILIKNEQWQGLGKDQLYQEICRYVIGAMREDKNDHFQFNNTMAAKFEDLRPDQSIARIWAQVQIGQREYGKVVIDAGVMPPNVDIERNPGRDVLGFADVDNPTISVTSREFLIGDKVTLFLERGITGERPRDLVHAAILLQDERYSDGALCHWLENLARVRGVEDKLLQPLPDPTDNWLKKIDDICNRYQLNINARDCYEQIDNALDRLFAKN